jgi:hypothetical protein
MCELAIALWLLVATICKLSINPITNPNPVYSHSYTWQYWIDIIKFSSQFMFFEDKTCRLKPTHVMRPFLEFNQETDNSEWRLGLFLVSPGKCTYNIPSLQKATTITLKTPYPVKVHYCLLISPDSINPLQLKQSHKQLNIQSSSQPT